MATVLGLESYGHDMVLGKDGKISQRQSTWARRVKE